MKLTKTKLKDMIREELNEGKDYSAMGLISKNRDLSDVINILHWAKKVVPGSKNDVAEATKLSQKLKKLLEKIAKDLSNVGQ